MSKSFVRGGQLALHSIRMLKQVSVTLLKFWAVVSSIVIVGYGYFKLSSYQIYAAFWYMVAAMLVDFGLLDYQLALENSNGNKTVLSTADTLIKFAPYKRQFLAIAFDVLELVGTLGIVLLFLAIIIFFHRGRKVSKDQKLRGNILAEARELRSAIQQENKKEKYKAYDLAGIPYPAHSEQLHTLIAGTTGAGKTVLISGLIDQIRKRGDRAIVYDKMGIYTERFYEEGRDVLLNPFDQRSPNWSVFKEVRSDANFDSIAAAFMPIDKTAADTFWIKAARTLFAEVCAATLKKGGVSNSKLTSILLKKNLEEAAKLVKGTVAQALIDPKSPKTALSVMAMLSTYLKCLKFLKDGGENFSIKDWIHDESKGNCIFLTSTGDLHATLLPLLSAWIEIAINNLLSLTRSRERKIWLILDELPSLHTLPSLEQGLAESRQFGGCFVLSIQSISQLRSRYGMNGSQTISSLCNNKIFLRAGDHDSARWYSESIGYVEVEEFREGLSYGAHEMRDGITVNRQKVLKPLALPTELSNLGDREGYFCMAKGYSAAKVEFGYVDWPKKNERLIEEPQILGKVKETEVKEYNKHLELQTEVDEALEGFDEQAIENNGNQPIELRNLRSAAELSPSGNHDTDNSLVTEDAVENKAINIKEDEERLAENKAKQEVTEDEVLEDGEEQEEAQANQRLILLDE